MNLRSIFITIVLLYQNVCLAKPIPQEAPVLGMATVNMMAPQPTVVLEPAESTPTNPLALNSESAASEAVAAATQAEPITEGSVTVAALPTSSVRPESTVESGEPTANDTPAAESADTTVVETTVLPNGASETESDDGNSQADVTTEQPDQEKETTMDAATIASVEPVQDLAAPTSSVSSTTEATASPAPEAVPVDETTGPVVSEPAATALPSTSSQTPVVTTSLTNDPAAPETSITNNNTVVVAAAAAVPAEEVSTTVVPASETNTTAAATVSTTTTAVSTTSTTTMQTDSDNSAEGDSDSESAEN